MSDLTPAEAAAELNVHLETIKRNLRSGAIPGYRVGNLWRISREALNDLKGRSQTIQTITRAHAIPNPLSDQREQLIIDTPRTSELAWQRNDPAKAIEFLQSLIDADDDEEQKETLEYLMRVIDEDRPGQRRVFGQGYNP